MTKVQVSYELKAQVDAEMLRKIDAAHGIYGLQTLQLSPGMDTLLVQYDASRMGLADVDHALHTAGLPAVRNSE